MKCCKMFSYRYMYHVLLCRACLPCICTRIRPMNFYRNSHHNDRHDLPCIRWYLVKNPGKNNQKFPDRKAVWYLYWQALVCPKTGAKQALTVTVPAHLWPSPRKPCGQRQPDRSESWFHKKNSAIQRYFQKYKIVLNESGEQNHWTEQAENVCPFLVSNQQPPLLIAHLPGPKAVNRSGN